MPVIKPEPKSPSETDPIVIKITRFLDEQQGISGFTMHYPDGINESQKELYAAILNDTNKDTYSDKYQVSFIIRDLYTLFSILEKLKRRNLVIFGNVSDKEINTSTYKINNTDTIFIKDEKKMTSFDITYSGTHEIARQYDDGALSLGEIQIKRLKINFEGGENVIYGPSEPSSINNTPKSINEELINCSFTTSLEILRGETRYGSGIFGGGYGSIFFQEVVDYVPQSGGARKARKKRQSRKKSLRRNKRSKSRKSKKSRRSKKRRN